MSIFIKLPYSLCRELEAITRNFLWDNKVGKPKISWVNWEKLCFPKEKIGLGFGFLSAFNQTLVAKQAWHQITPFSFGKSS